MMHLNSSKIGFSKKGYERTFRSRTLRPIPGTKEDIDLDDSFKTIREYYFFGSGPQGQLGAAQENIVGVPTKTLVPGGGKLKIGFNHCAHISDDELVLRTWGFNQTGQLGLSHRNETRAPAVVSGLHGEKIKDVFCGTFQTFVLTENIRSGIQSLWQFGAGYVSDSPEKFTRHSIFPVKLNLKSVVGENTKIKKVIPGNDFCFIIDDTNPIENNQVYAFGDNDYGALGHDIEFGDQQEVFQLPTPSLIKTFAASDIEVYDIKAGWNHAIALTNDGLYAWGNNTEGECGINKNTPKLFVPRKIPFFSGINVAQIATGSTHCLALDESGFLFVWGSNNDGKLGIGDDSVNKLIEPQLLDGFYKEKIVKIACGGEHSVALTNAGDVWVWGNGEYGQLSRQTKFHQSPFPIKLPKVSFEHDDSGKFERMGKGPNGLSAKVVWNVAYDHTVTDIMCGASFTVLELSSSVKQEVKKKVIDAQNQQFETQEEKEERSKKEQEKLANKNVNDEKQREEMKKLDKTLKKLKKKNTIADRKIRYVLNSRARKLEQLILMEMLAEKVPSLGIDEDYQKILKTKKNKKKVTTKGKRTDDIKDITEVNKE